MCLKTLSKQIIALISIFNSYNTILLIILGLYFWKNVIFSFVLLASISNNKSDKFMGQEKKSLYLVKPVFLPFNIIYLYSQV